MLVACSFLISSGVVSAANGYLWDGRRVEFSLLHVVQTGSEAHPASYPMGTGTLYPGEKRQGREAYHSPPTSVKVKITCIYIYTLPYALMA
jgi:hypothetical protein